MQNLNELWELRVLNLGSNRIATLENIDKLALLTELNLRRNQIERISANGKLPSLQRLFLSNNRIETLEVLDALLPVRNPGDYHVHDEVVELANYRSPCADRSLSRSSRSASCVSMGTP